VKVSNERMTSVRVTNVRLSCVRECRERGLEMLRGRMYGVECCGFECYWQLRFEW